MNSILKANSGILLWLAGLAIGLAIGGWQLHTLRAQFDSENAQTVNLLDSARAQMDTLKKQADLADAARQACMKSFTGAITQDLNATAVHTILADQKHPDGMAASVTILGHKIDYSSAGPVWVIPRRVTPVLQNDAQGAVYAYVGSDGQPIDGWHIATKGQ